MNPYTPDFYPADGVTPAIASRYGCDLKAVQARFTPLFDSLKATKSPSYIPQVGMDACNVLAHVGAPSRIGQQQTADGRSETWWYHKRAISSRDAKTHMVTLQLTQGKPGSSPWVVDYVGW